MKSTSMQKANKIFFIVSKSILFILLMYKLNYLYTYRNFKDNKNLIEYTLLKSTKYSGGKGNHYSMDILYNDKSHQLTLTSKEYQNLNKKTYLMFIFTNTNYLPIGVTNNIKDICMC